jgi:tetratricopeptide (TPR) repeat protein
MPEASAAAPNPEGEELIGGLYAIEAELGRGGMGAVYRVRDSRTGQRLALKRLHQKAGSTPALLFEREYFTLAELAHPRIIEVYDYGVDTVGAYYTMELLDGTDLREKRNLPVPEACALLCDVASSLAILHSRGLLHRDVSPRNVRCTADGRAKLIDFGAMAPMGVNHEIVGTPPCMAPETLQLQALDGRADLYALGAVAYWMFAGRFPYPARSLEDLPELWYGKTRLPDAVAPGLPEALSRLILQLISIERDARPSTAGEVVERLSAIAGLKLDSDVRIAGAYLATPTLVDRESFITWARARIDSLIHRQGMTLVIEGDPGTGRTRALDACVAEAKRAGATVARAAASDAARKDYGVATVLARQLLTNLPQHATALGVQDRAILGHLLPELRRAGDPEINPERRYIQATLRDWLLGLARHQRLMLAVDDVEQVDEPSAALLAMLSHEITRRGMIIAATITRDAGDALASNVLTRLGSTFRLAPLSEAKTEELVRSVFGDVENVVGVAARVHAIARGNPRDTMQLLRHLVKTGVARCEGAAWLLPSAIAESDLPDSMRSVFEARLTNLSAEARELAEALALADGASLAIEDYPALTDNADPGRLFSALGALVQAGVLLPEGEHGDRYRFAETNAPAWLSERMAPEQKRLLHSRLAELTGRRGARVRRLHHLIESGQAQLAISELVDGMDTDALDYSRSSVDLLERALAASIDLALPEAHRLALKLRLSGVSAVIADLTTFRRYAPPILARLRKDSGLDDWEQLGAELADGERLQQALMRASARFEASPELERGFSPFESIRRLARLMLGYTGMSGQATDHDLIAGLPSLRPFFMLSPATQVIQSIVDGELAMEQGRVTAARKSFPAALARIAEPDGAGLEPVIRDQLKYSTTYIVAAIDASRALKSTLAFADELDKVPRHRTNAWHVRRSYYRMLGHVGKVRECQRRIELLQLRDGPQPFRSVNFRSDLPACWLCDDFTGLKSSFSGIDAEAARFPRLRVLANLARCHYHRLLGEYDTAFAYLKTALDLAEPGRHLDWHYVAYAHIELLALLGRPEEAIQQADTYEKICHEREIDRALLGIGLMRSRALLAIGRAEEARECCERQIAAAEAEGVGGILVARFYELRARIALALDDRNGFERWAARFGEFSQAAENPAIRAQYERLMRLGAPSGETPFVIEAAGRDGATVMDQLTSATVSARMVHCVDRTERARLALSFVLDACGATGGHLFGLRLGNLEHLCSFPDQDAPQALRSALADLVDHERQGDEHTAIAQEAGSADRKSPYDRIAELGFGARVLFDDRSGDPAMVGVVAVEQKGEKAAMVPPQLASAIAEALAERGDVDPVTVFAS